MIRTRLLWFSLGFASASGAIAQFVFKDLWMDRNSLTSQVKSPLKVVYNLCGIYRTRFLFICMRLWISEIFYCYYMCSWRKSLIRWIPECPIWNPSCPTNPLHLRYYLFVCLVPSHFAFKIFNLCFSFFFFSVFKNLEFYCQVTEEHNWNHCVGISKNSSVYVLETKISSCSGHMFCWFKFLK